MCACDRKTIPLLRERWAESGQDRGGVVLVDEKSISASDFGGLNRAIQSLICVRHPGFAHAAARLCPRLTTVIK